MKKLVIATLIFTMFVCSVIGLTACRADDSPAPTIEVGSDGYWYINGEKTDYLAQGEQGIKGDKGDNGENGSNGLDGKTPEISIGDNGNWFIDGVDTGVKATGEKGEKGDKGDQGEKGSDGKDGVDGSDGKDGSDGLNGSNGKTPEITIGDNGNWFVDGVDTGVKATGAKGDQGEQGEKGDKGEQGEKGDKGDQGEQGEKGSDGKDGVNGSDGKNGQHGKSAYELYVEKYGYVGSEEEWLDDLVNGRLGMRETYTVTFDSNGGSEVESQEVLDGKRAYKPYAPSRTGYTFGGWYLDSTEWNFAIYTITDDTTLTAKWTANTYTVKFVSEDETPLLPEIVATYDDDYELPTPPEKERHHFVGWSDGEKLYDLSGKWTTASDVTLTAIYQPDTFTITFEDAEVDPMKVAYNDDSYTLPVPEKEGYMFFGWYLNGEQFTGGNCLVENITLTAKWGKATEEYAYSDENDEIIILKLKSGVTEFTVPTEVDGLPVTYIASDAFADNTDLVSLTFDGSFENYTEKMLQGCTSLKNLVLSGSYDNYLYVLFGNDITAVPESLETISFALNSPSINTTMLGKKMANHTITYVIPEGITEIKSMQYNDLEGLTSLSLPKTLKNIGYNAFHCFSLSTYLTNVEYAGTFADWCQIDGLRNLLFSYDVPKITKINGMKLEGEIRIPEGITEIKIGTFIYCNDITSVIIPDGVTTIGSDAFHGCEGITAVTIPESVTKIDARAFQRCISLETIYFTGTMAQWNEIQKSNDWAANAKLGFKIVCDDGEIQN